MSRAAIGNRFKSVREVGRRLLGIELAPVGHLERMISAAGGVLAVLLLIELESGLLGEAGAAMLVASMGATAVLLFAVPHGALSQPWAVLVGHTSSAMIGVACAQLIGNVTIAAALAVGLSIGVMHYLRAIHPPGGATALTAVIGGPQVHALGFTFVVTPVLLNALIMVVAAVLINAAFRWRRYPAGWARAQAAARSSAGAGPAVHAQSAMTHADFTEALRRIGTFVDISEDEFVRLTQLTQEAAESRRLLPQQIHVGGYYSNGAFGEDWAVRLIVDAAPGDHAGDVIWRVVAGRDRNITGLSSRRELAQWAACEVRRSESTWVRADDGNTDATMT